MTFEVLKEGIIISQWDGVEWHRDLFETKDELLLWAHARRIDVDADDLFEKRQKLLEAA